MSESSTPAPADNAPATPKAAQSDSVEPLGEGGLKALQTERDRAKALEKALNDSQGELQKFKDAQLSELERAQKAAAEAQEKVAAAQVEALRYRIAAKHGISDDDAELFLTGSDEATMSRQAARLLERTPTTPRPDPSQGASSGDLALNGDPLLASLKDKLGIV